MGSCRPSNPVRRDGNCCGGGAARPTEVPAPNEAPIATPESNRASADEGMSLAEEQGCLGCHTTDGRELIGPTWNGLFGKEEQLVYGTTVTVDDAYLRESILNPKTKIVERFVKSYLVNQDRQGHFQAVRQSD